MPRRVLYCEVCEDGTVGGSHQILFDLACALDPARYVPHVVFYQENRFAEALRKEGVAVTIWEAQRARERRAFPDGSRPAQLLGLARGIAARVRLLRSQGIDLVHLNNSPLLGHDDWLPAARLCGVASVVNAVGEPYTPPTGPVARRLATGWDRIIAISDHIAGKLAEGAFPSERLCTVVAGIDVPGFVARATRAPAALRAELGVAEGEVLAVMVGNLRPWKGQAQVVKALARIGPEARAQLRVVFAGAARDMDASYVAELEGAIAAAGWADRARLLGPRLDVPDLVNAADILVHASTFPEPFGLVVVEGLALGKPVIAARHGGPIEILREGSGFLHDPDDPSELAELLTRLARDPALRASVGRAARARADELDARRVARQVQAVYDEVLAGRGAVAPAGSLPPD